MEWEKKKKGRVFVGRMKLRFQTRNEKKQQRQGKKKKSASHKVPRKGLVEPQFFSIFLFLIFKDWVYFFSGFEFKVSI